MHNTIKRSIRLYAHEWLLLDRLANKLTKLLQRHEGYERQVIGVNRVLAYLADCDVVLDETDIVAHTEAARAKDKKRTPK